MATLYVENIPEERYEALKAKAAMNKRSISAEIMDLLESFYPTEEEIERRHAAVERIIQIGKTPPLTPGSFPSGLEMLREDRDR